MTDEIKKISRQVVIVRMRIIAVLIVAIGFVAFGMFGGRWLTGCQSDNPIHSPSSKIQVFSSNEAVNVNAVVDTATAPPRDIWIIVWGSFATFMTGPGTTYSGPCSALNDINKDGHIDMLDVQIIQGSWQCVGPSFDYCGYVYTPEFIK